MGLKNNLPAPLPAGTIPLTLRRGASMNEDKCLTVDDLVTALINEAHFRDAAEELTEYYTKKLQLLKELFCLDPKQSQPRLGHTAAKKRSRRGSQPSAIDGLGGEEISRFVENCVEAFRRTKSPFRMGTYLEGMPPVIVRDLEHEYGEQISTQERELNRINRLLINKVLMSLFPGIEKKKIPEGRLFEMGLPKEEPDPDDYL
jgi:hypothetical protein